MSCPYDETLGIFWGLIADTLIPLCQDFADARASRVDDIR